MTLPGDCRNHLRTRGLSETGDRQGTQRPGDEQALVPGAVNNHYDTDDEGPRLALRPGGSILLRFVSALRAVSLRKWTSFRCASSRPSSRNYRRLVCRCSNCERGRPPVSRRQNWKAQAVLFRIEGALRINLGAFSVFGTRAVNYLFESR